MSQLPTSDMAQASPPSSALPAVTLGENASSKKRKVDKIEDKSPDGPPAEETMDETDANAASFEDPDAPAQKKLKVSELPNSIEEIRNKAQLRLHWAPATYKEDLIEWFVAYATEHHQFPSRPAEATWIKEHEENRANALQVLRKKQRDDKAAKMGKGTFDYVKSSRKVRLNPHRPHVQEEVEDETMMDQEEMQIQQVTMQQANGAQQVPVTGDADTEMEIAKSKPGPTSLQDLVAADAAHNSTINGDQTVDGQSATQTATDPSSSKAPGVAASSGVATIQSVSSSSFNRELPPLYKPWNLNHAQPRARYAQDTPCPINWDAFSSELDVPDREAYEFRAPWNPKPLSWEAAVKAYVEKHGKENAKIKSPEGLRKRFKRANRAIFEKERVYFYMSSLGLEDHGIPIDAKLAAMEKMANDPTVNSAQGHTSGEDKSEAKQPKDRKKRVLLPCHVRQSAPPLTIQKLFKDYNFAKTIDERDMILDKIYRVLVNEKTLNAKYSGNGAVCEGDIHEVVRLLDLDSNDISDVSPSSRLCKLLVDIWLHDVDVEKARKLRSEALRSVHHARELYKDFARNRRQNAIVGFVESISPEAFCEMYHQHHESGQECYRDRPNKEHKPIPHIFRGMEVNGLWGYTIENKTGLRFDMQATIYEERRWDWERVKAVSYYIQFPPRGPQKRVRAPHYYDRGDKDVNGHYPSHPEYEAVEGGPISAWDLWAREAYGDAYSEEKLAKYKKVYFTHDPHPGRKIWKEEGWDKPFGA